jgi:hypothetical protein
MKEPLQGAREALAVHLRPAAAGVVEGAVQGVKEKDGGETGRLHRPRAGRRSLGEELGQIVDDGVAMSGAAIVRPELVKDQVVQGGAVEIAVDAGLDPDPQASLPVVGAALEDRRLEVLAEGGHEALLESDQQLHLRFEVNVEGALGHIGRDHDLVDAGGGDTLVQEDALGGIHELLSPHLRGLGAGTPLGHGAEND